MIAATLAPGLTVNLNLLETFLLVAEHSSFRAAGVRSGRSNSAITTHIKQLEVQLSVSLFHRTTRSVSLTAEGKMLEDAVRRGMAEIRVGLTQAQGDNMAILRRIAIACSSSLAWKALPPIVESYRAEKGHAQLDVLEASIAQVESALLANEFALAIGAIGQMHDQIDYETLVTDPIVALIPAKFPQANLSSISLAELCSLGLILPARFSVTRQMLEEEFAKQKIIPKIAHEGAGFFTLLAMVEAGIGVAAFSDLISRQYKSTNFRRVPIYGGNLAMPIGMAMLKERKPMSSREDLIRIIRREARSWVHH